MFWFIGSRDKSCIGENTIHCLNAFGNEMYKWIFSVNLDPIILKSRLLNLATVKSNTVGGQNKDCIKLRQKFKILFCCVCFVKKNIEREDIGFFVIDVKFVALSSNAFFFYWREQAKLLRRLSGWKSQLLVFHMFLGYSVFHRFRQAKFANGGLILSLSQFLLQP